MACQGEVKNRLEQWLIKFCTTQKVNKAEIVSAATKFDEAALTTEEVDVVVQLSELQTVVNQALRDPTG